MIVGLAGTDLYRDMPKNTAAMTVTDNADALIVLQAEAADRVAAMNQAWADKTNVIYQSTTRQLPGRTPVVDEFRVVVLAHLREVKDPLLAARASRKLSDSSQVTVHHGGRAHDKTWEERAIREMEANHRYTWHRELDAEAALVLLATADVLACTSLSEGGANVVTEALAMGVPVIGTRIGGNVGILGEDHPGLFPVGDAETMAAVLHRLETDRDAMADLVRRTKDRSKIAAPENERAGLSALIDRLAGSI